MKKETVIYDFEGRYEKKDTNFRYFEVTQLKKGGFLVDGVCFDTKSGNLKPFTTVISLSDKTSKEEALDKIKKFIDNKLERDYKYVGGIDKIKHDRYRYPQDIINKYLNKTLTIITSNSVENKTKIQEVIKPKVHLRKAMVKLFE